MVGVLAAVGDAVRRPELEISSESVDEPLA
jgi:hypothetical protein